MDDYRRIERFTTDRWCVSCEVITITKASMPYLTEVLDVGGRQWRNTVSRLLVDVELSSEDMRTFEGSLRCRTVAGVRFADVRASPCHSRAEGNFAHPSGSAYILCYQLAGSGWIRQAGKEACLLPGDIALYTTACSAEVAFGAGFHALSLRVPADYVDLPFGAIDSLVSTVLPTDHGMAPVMTGFLTRVAPLLDDGTPVVRHHAVKTGLSLFSTFVGSLADERASWIGSADVTNLAREARSHIDDHLGEPGLCPATIARVLHVSVRQLHKSFGAGDTVAAYIRRQRLGRCARDLADPMRHHETVSHIGRRWGFESASHFGHLFRQVYGQSPAAYRQAAINPGQVADRARR